MSCLDATFTLTPKSPAWESGVQSAYLWCFGADFAPGFTWDFSALYSTDRFRFSPPFASDPTRDYRQWSNLRAARFLETNIDVSSPGKQLILIFGFDTTYGGRVLVYSDAARLADRMLLNGDNQFAIEIESLDQALTLYFIHAGGDWFFKGLTGYLV